MRLGRMLLWGAALGGAAAPASAENVLVLVADDLGVDALAVYDESSACSGNGEPCETGDDCPGAQTCTADYPATPTIDQLADEGVLFRNAWATPTCTPTRATIQTGRAGHRTGVLAVGNPLPATETILPEILATLPDAVSHAAIGKWHLGGGQTGPLDAGYSHYAGSIGGGVSDYFAWQRNVDGTTQTCSSGSSACPIVSYATSVNVDDALNWISGRDEPWFLWLSFNAPHAPFHVPPHALVSPGTLVRLPTDGGSPAPPGTTCTGAFRRPCYLAAIEAMDAEIDRLLAGIPEDTTVIFIGDNGTPGQVIAPPLDNTHAKGSLYEGGINVPLIIKRVGTTPADPEREQLVQSADLFATVLDLMGAAPPEDDRVRDGVSLVPVLEDASASHRESVYSEATAEGQAARDARFKLIRRPEGYDELYDLLLDPFERDDLLLGSCSTTTTTECHLDADCPPGETCAIAPLSGTSQGARITLGASIEDVVSGAGRVPDGAGDAENPLRVGRAGSVVQLDWDPSCLTSDDDYAVYEGTLGAWSTQIDVTCTTAGATFASFLPVSGNRYFLVVPHNGTRAGSYGFRSDGTPRPTNDTCFPSSDAGCD